MPGRRAILVLAAGKGVRMKSDLPKVMHKACGRPMLQYVLDTAASLEPDKIVVVVGHGKEGVRAAFAERQVEWAVQKKLLGTAHAVMSAARQLENFAGDVIVLAGDVPLIRRETLEALAHFHRSQRATCTILSADIEDPSGYGRIVRAKDGRVRAIVEHRDATEKQRRISEINTGILIFKAAELFKVIWKVKSGNDQGEFYLTDVVELLMKKRRKVVASVISDESETFGVNSRAQLARVSALLRGRILENLMESGVTIIDPDNTYIEADVTIGRDTTILPYTVIESGVAIGKGCEVGPFAHLRAGTVMEDGSEVGNFTEVKKGRLGKKSKAKHLSYLGDVKIGSGVNIGAGTIVANYDGRDKHPTVIGDDASIGSGTVLVAPVKIGKGAVTGAGAVVTRNKDVPQGGIVAGVPAKPLKKAKSRSKSKKRNKR